MHTSSIALLVLGACCAIPLVESLFVTDDVTLFKILAAIGGGLVTFYQVRNAYSSDHSSEALHQQSSSIERRLERLGDELSVLQQHASVLTLDPDTRGDMSESGMAWKRIHARLTDSAYAQYCATYPESPYVAEATRRRYSIGHWQAVDKKDPFDIHFFILTGPFNALRMEAESRIHEATDASRLEHRAELWRQVGIPFYVLAPLLILIYPIGFIVLVGLYKMTAEPPVSGYLSAAARHLNGVFVAWQSAWPVLAAGPAQAASAYLDQILRLATAALALIASLTVLKAIGLAIVRTVLQPRVESIEKQLGEANEDIFRTV